MAKKVITYIIPDEKLASGLIEYVKSNRLNDLKTLLVNGYNPNAQNAEGMTALHVAVGSNNPEAVKLLLEYGADETIKNSQGLSPCTLNALMPNKDIENLLNPEQVIKKHDLAIEIEKGKSEYMKDKKIDVDKEVLKKLAATYIQSDKVEIISNPLIALKYMYNALNYMVLDLLEAKKYEAVSGDFKPKAVAENYKPYDPYYSNLGSPIQNDEMAQEYQEMILNYQQSAMSQADNDDKWNHDYLAYEMLQAISACVGYLRENDVGKLSKLALFNINWKALALFARENQYSPNFVGNLDYSKKLQLINEALHSILDVGELGKIASHVESLIKSIEGVQQLEDQKIQLENDLKDPGILKEAKKQIPEEIKQLKAKITKENSNKIDNYEPKLLAVVIGFIKDEHSVQCIKGATTIIQDFYIPENLPSILNSLIKIGEALDEASPKLKNLFHPKAVQDVESFRNLLCHPEIPENSVQIKNLLTNGDPVVVISGNKFDLMQLAKYWGQQSELITKFLAEMYDNTLSTADLWNKIKDMADQYFSKATSNAQKHNESDELSYLESKSFKTIHDLTTICDLRSKKSQEDFNEQKSNLDQGITGNFAKHQFKDNLKTKLKDSKKSLQEVSTYLQTNGEAYTKAKEPGEITPEKQKVLTDYENMQMRQQLWQEYNNNLKTLDANKDKEIQSIIKWKDIEIDKIISFMLDEYITYAENVRGLFNEINVKQPQLADKIFDECQYLDEDGTWQIDMDKAQKIGSLDLEHSKLEFYQIMVGSLARGLLELTDKVESFKEIFPNELSDILKDTVIASRSYLAHIGMRQEGKPFNEAIDRPKVFFENSKKVIESVQYITKLAQVKEVPLNKDWYDFLAIKDGLKKKGVHNENVLNTVENNEQLKTELNKINESNHVYIIPLNVNGINGSFTATNHWVGLYICTDENAKIKTIQYLNPIGQSINQELIDTIFNHTEIIPKDITEGKGIQFAYADSNGILQGNTWDCGSLLVQLLTELFSYGTIQTQTQNYLESILLGQKCRGEQRYDEAPNSVSNELTTVEPIKEEEINREIEEEPINDLGTKEPDTVTELGSSEPEVFNIDYM